MPKLELKPAHKVVTACYESLTEFAKPGIKYETAVRTAPPSLRDYQVHGQTGLEDSVDAYVAALKDVMEKDRARLKTRRRSFSRSRRHLLLRQRRALRFWREVECACPDFEVAKRWLTQHSSLLK